MAVPRGLRLRGLPRARPRGHPLRQLKRALVTGAAGFVGANLVRRLLTDGHDVHAVIRPGTSAWRLSDAALDSDTVEADVRDAAVAANVVRRARPDWIFHLAASGAYSWQANARDIFETNVLGTVAVLEAAVRSGVEAFVHAGSSSEYGAKDHAPAETERLEPNSAYAVAKAAATLYCRHVALAEDVNALTLRLYSVYGPYEDPRRLMPTLIVRGLRGELPPLVDPGTPRDFVHVDDVVDAFLLAAERPTPRGAVYNVGSGHQTTLRELVDLARTVLEIPVAPRWGSEPARSWDTETWISDPRRIQADLGWTAHVTLEAGFRNMVDWLAASPLRTGVYGI